MKKYNKQLIEYMDIVTPKYIKIASQLLKLSPDIKTKKKMLSILFKGHLNDFSINSGTIDTSNPDIEAQRRLRYG